MGNVKLFELCETIPEVQCSECLLYWNQGIVYCTCGHLLRENKSSRHLHRWQLGILSIPNYAIKKERHHGNRYGKIEAPREHFIAHNARKRCIKKGFQGIHDRFQKDLRFRDNAKLIGLKQNASRWTSWRRKISPIAHHQRSMRDKRKPGLSLWTHLAGMHRWNSDQTSAKHLKRCTVFTVSLEKSDSHRFQSTSIGNGIRRLLLPAHHGGSDMTIGGAHRFIKVKYLWAREMSGITEQGDLLKRLYH